MIDGGRLHIGSGLIELKGRENMSQPVKVGIVGLGRVGWGSHCKDLGNLPEQFEITAVCDPIELRRQNAAEEYGCKTYDHIDQMIADPEIELINLCTRSIDHFSQAKQVLAAGKKVLIEKPFALTYVEAKQLIEEAAKHGNEQLFVRHNRRFDPDFLKVKEIMDRGILGDVFNIKLYRHSYQRRDDWQTIKAYGGGQLLNWGPHIIDHALQLLQGPVKELWGDLKRVTAAGDAEDHVKIVMTDGKGRTVDLEISGGIVYPSPQFQVFGSRGGMTVTGNDIALKYLDPERLPAEKEADPGTPGEKAGTTGNYRSEDELHWVEESLQVPPRSNEELWIALYKSIRHNEPYPIRSEEALEVMRVISEVKKGTPFA